MSLLECILLQNALFSIHLAGFLPASSILALQRVNRQGRDACAFWKKRRVLSKRVIAALARLGYDDAFCKACLDGEAIVSGSMVLHAVEGGDWRANDVDVYQTVERSTWGSVIENHLWTRANEDYHNYRINHHHEYNCFAVRSYRLAAPAAAPAAAAMEESISAPPASLPTTTTTSQWCQVMSIFNKANQEVTPVEWIRERYDLAFLMNTFDGQNVTIHDAVSLITGAAPYRPHNARSTGTFGARECQLERIRKYQARGFVIPNVRRVEVICDDDRWVKSYLNGRLWGSELLGKVEAETCI
jgi:hypothetical protein